MAPLHHSLLRSRTINESGRQGAPGHGWHAAISRFARPANVHEGRNATQSRVVRPSMRSARAITARRLRTGRYISASVSLTHWPTTASDVVLEVVLAARRCKCALSSPAVAPLHHSLLRSRTINESGRQGAPGHGWHAAISRFARPANVHIVPGTVARLLCGTTATALMCWGHIESCLF